MCKKPALFALAVCLALSFSCARKTVTEEAPSLTQDLQVAKKHSWYYFSESGVHKAALPQNSPAVVEKPWTEALRAAAAASLIPGADASKLSSYDAYAVINKAGILCFSGEQMELFKDAAIFSFDTADSIVFSDSMPIFYLYRSTFFNESIDANKDTVHKSRPFLVEFNPAAKICYPLVSYENLKLSNDDQITGFFWNGRTWTCSAKREKNSRVEFSYFYWQPLVPMGSLTPALGQETFLFHSLSEEEYKAANMPRLFSEAPEELRKLLKSVPHEFPFYVSWRDLSGTSPISYFQQGNGAAPLNACAFMAPLSGYAAAVFADGTTYVRSSKNGDAALGFRLPRLPQGFTYSYGAISGDILYVFWEEVNFYKTARAGLIQVSLLDIFKAD